MRNLEPDQLDRCLLLEGALPGCPFCQGTPATINRLNEETEIFRSIISCTQCAAQVGYNAKTRDEARQGAIARWRRRDNQQERNSDAPAHTGHFRTSKLNDELANGGPDQLLKAKACVALINSAVLLRQSVNESYFSRVDSPDDLAGYLANVLDVWHKAHPDLMVQDILTSLESIRHKLTEGMIGLP